VEKSMDSQPVVLVDDHDTMDPRVRLAKIRNIVYAYPLLRDFSMGDEMKAADGLLSPCNTMATMLNSNDYLKNTAVLLGCDPAFSILGHHVQKTGIDADVYCRFASSKKSLTQLAKGQAHLAGIHMHDKGGIDGNQELTEKLLKNFKGVLVAFSFFEEGLLVAKGNPFDIRKPEDLAQKQIRFVNREKGAALRHLLDDLVCESDIPFSEINGYDNIVLNHSQGAQKILHGVCDAALGLKAVATAFNLGFVPLSRVRCDLVIPWDLLDHTGVKTALDTLQKQSFKNELSSIPGYDSSCTGKIIKEF
jgi:molybdate-binding protein